MPKKSRSAPAPAIRETRTSILRHRRISEQAAARTRTSSKKEAGSPSHRPRLTAPTTNIGTDSDSIRFWAASHSRKEHTDSESNGSGSRVNTVSARYHSWLCERYSRGSCDQKVLICGVFVRSKSTRTARRRSVNTVDPNCSDPATVGRGNGNIWINSMDKPWSTIGPSDRRSRVSRGNAYPHATTSSGLARTESGNPDTTNELRRHSARGRLIT